MTGERNSTSRIYRHRVASLLEQLDALRRHQNLLQAAGVRGRTVVGLERRTEQLRCELATTIASRAGTTNAAVSAT